MTTLNPTPMHQPRSLFWPLVLIGVGVLWLLRSLNVVSTANIAVLLRLWPLLLIAAGVNILVARRSPRYTQWVAVGTVAVFLVAMFAIPALGIGKLETKTDHFDEAISPATSADVTLALGVGHSTVQALTDSAKLITADVTHMGDIKLTATGTTTKTIRLSQNDESSTYFNTDWTFNSDDLRWNINLTPNIPLRLTINAGVGDANLDLSQLNLVSLECNTGVGDGYLTLPSSETSYPVQVDAGVGKTVIEIREGASLTLNVTAGVGSTEIVLPKDAAVRLEAQNDMGSMNLSSILVRTNGDDAKRGVWTTSNYDTSERKITITFKGGLGGLTVR